MTIHNDDVIGMIKKRCAQLPLDWLPEVISEMAAVRHREGRNHSAGGGHPK
jgi:hypothetical protein